MTKFQHWKERLVAESGVPSARVRYTRKSTTDDGRQIASHEQQNSECDREWGAISPAWVWRDSASGTSFRRPAFQDLLAYCQDNPQPKSARGVVEMYDPARFGRSLDVDGKPDVMAFLTAYGRFQECGWQLRFVTVKLPNDGLGDVLTMAIYAYAAALYSESISKNVRRGRVAHASNGWWTAGAAPWGTKRFDARANRELPTGVASSPGGGGVILIPDKKVLQLWERAARMVLGGISLDRVGAALFEEGVRGRQGGKLGHSAIKNLLTNRVLIGRVSYLGPADADGVRQPVESTAQWAPMVDVDVFEQVVQRFRRTGRKVNGVGERRAHDVYPLSITCGHCGLGYDGNRMSIKQGGGRRYRHANPKERAHADAYAAFHSAGCKVWDLDADEIETSIKELITRERASVAFADEVRELITKRDMARTLADAAVTDAKAELVKAESSHKRLVRLAMDAMQSLDESEDDRALSDSVAASLQQVKQAKANVKAAERFAQQTERAWEQLSSTINETKNLAAAWDRVSAAERKILLDYWVYDVTLVVEPVPGMKRANNKTALVALRTNPHAPRSVGLASGYAGNVAMAARSSDKTHSSRSMSARSRSGASPSGEPILPSAQAAWPLISGSSSDSAAASTGTAAGSRELPSETATLRKNPRRLARLIGDLRENSTHSGSDIPIQSINDGDSNHGLALNASSLTGFANLRVNGHTS